MAELKIYTYDELLTRMLARVSPEIDKRQGSIMYDTLSLEALELAQHYAELPDLINLFYPDTAVDEWLDKSCEQYGGIKRKQATQAIRQVTINDRSGQLMQIPIGSRFRINDITLIIIKEVVKGSYHGRVEQFGVIGNNYSGSMLPISNINDLGSATLEGVIVSAQDKESNDEYRARFFYLNNRPAFGGNIADYEIEALDIEGVGAVVVFPIWNGDGTVKLVIGDTNHNQASPELVEIVQNKFMPLNAQQLGTGLAPVGHNVTVTTSTDLDINVTAEIDMDDGYNLADVKSQIDQNIQDYINNIPFKDSIIYVARVMSVILNVTHVADVTSVLLNGTMANITLNKTAISFQTPKVKDIILSEV